MIEDGLSYPFEGNEAVKNLVIGGLLNVFGFLVLPVLIVQGYYIAVLRTTIQGYDQMPAFQEWGTLLVDGLKAAVITFVYSIVPLILFVVLMSVLGAGANGSSDGIIAGFGLLFLLLLFLAYALIAYLAPAALSHFAYEGSFGAAFDFGTITDVITHGEYLKAFVMAIVVGFLIGIVAIILQITIIGIILLPWLYFYAGAAIFRMYARAYATAISGRQAGHQQTTGRQAQNY